MRGVFCDWITLYQEHYQGCRRFDDGAVMSIDGNGVVEWETVKAVQVMGSNETRVRISSDGNRCRLHGNIGRFGRSDNVFGYSVAECVERANALMVLVGLPPFTVGKKVATRCVHSVGPESIESAGYTGAIVTRLDLTLNYSTGSQVDAGDYLNWLEGQQPGRLRACSYGENTTVTWGYGSKYMSSKVYNKYVEVIRHLRGENLTELCALLHNSGVVRGEVTLKSRFLRQHNLQSLGVVLGTDWEKIYMENFGDKIAPSAQVPDSHDIPNPYLGTFLAWRDGVDVSARMTRATFYRHRKYLLLYGYDIAVTSNVRRLPIKVREIRLSALSAPRWYVLPEASDVSVEGVVDQLGQKSA